MERFVVPGICAGNENVGGKNYRDVAGSLARRWMWFLFDQRVSQGALDMRLFDRLLDELPRIMFKCNHAYLEWVTLYGDRDLFAPGVSPAYFRQNRDAYKEESQPLVLYLKSDELDFGAGLYVPYEEVVRHYKGYINSKHHIRKEDIAFDKSSFVSELSIISEDLGFLVMLQRVSEKRRYPPGGPLLNTVFVNGMDIKRDVPSI